MCNLPFQVGVAGLVVAAVAVVLLVAAVGNIDAHNQAHAVVVAVALSDVIHYCFVQVYIDNIN